MDQWEIIRIAALYSIYAGILLFLVGIFVIALPYLFGFKRKWIRRVCVTVGVLFSIFVGTATYLLYTGFEIDRTFFSAYNKAVGNEVSDISFLSVSPDSTNMVLSDFKGRVVLLNYWATWCMPCVREMPDLSLLAENYPENLAVICISDEDPEKVISWLDGFTPLSQYIGVLTDMEELPDEQSIIHRVRPVTFIIDKEGNLRDYIIGAKHYDQFEEIILKYL